ncbi:MAG: hypothetical protein V1839_02495 [archaeon]
MTYKSDIDKLIGKYKGSECSKSEIAYGILEDFEQIREGIKDKKHLEFYTLDCLGLESVRRVVNNYAKGMICLEEASSTIKHLEIQSKLYLLSKGYDSTEARKNEERTVKAIEKRIEKVESLTAKIDALNKKMEEEK